MLADKIVNKLKKMGVKKVDVAMVLGSGLKNAMPELEDKIVINYDKLKMPKSKVKGHSGEFIYGKYDGKYILAAARYHYYENGNLALVRLPYEIFARLGAKLAILLTATGAVDPQMNAGDIMCITDHINLAGINPLIAEDVIKFVDLSNAYDDEQIANVKTITKKHKIDIYFGTHMQFSGPSYETPAEVKMAYNAGASTVSMSTAMDTIICRRYNIPVVAMASISNKAAATDDVDLITHEDVLRISNNNSDKFKIIIQELLKMNKF